MKEAYAWLQNRLVGRFFEGSDGATRFEYAPEASMPISLSLPLDCSWQADAPGVFLDGLLPDNDSEREAMRCWFGAASADPLDLLVATDATGGLCFTSVPEPGEIASLAREFVREKDIAIKVYRLGRGWTTWQSDDRRSRFALAGSQGKFALEQFDGRWTWPNAKHPSTHIVKPPHERFCGTPLVEDATMHLAAACGLDVARSFVRSFGEDQAYVVERFDREVCADGQVLRIHVEDFTQALGISRHAKYSVAAADAFALLKVCLTAARWLGSGQSSSSSTRWWGIATRTARTTACFCGRTEALICALSTTPFARECGKRPAICWPCRSISRSGQASCPCPIGQRKRQRRGFAKTTSLERWKP